MFAGYSQTLTDQVLERIRTDLDAFSEVEMSVLENHGYWVAERQVTRYVLELKSAGGTPSRLRRILIGKTS